MVPEEPEGIQQSVRGIQSGWPEHTDRCWTLGASVQAMQGECIKAYSVGSH